MEFRLIFRADDCEQYGKYLRNSNRCNKIMGNDSVIESKINFNDVQNSEVIDTHFGALKDYFELMNSSQKINSLNFCLSHCDEIIPALMIMNTVFCIENSREKKMLGIEDYFNNLKYNEKNQVKEIIACKMSGNSGYYKLSKGNYTKKNTISAAVYLELNKNKINAFKVALGGSRINPFRVYEIENLIAGKNVEYLYNNKIIQILCRKVNENITVKTDEIFDKDEITKVYEMAIKNAFKRIS